MRTVRYAHVAVKTQISRQAFGCARSPPVWPMAATDWCAHRVGLAVTPAPGPKNPERPAITALAPGFGPPICCLRQLALQGSHGRNTARTNRLPDGRPTCARFGRARKLPGILPWLMTVRNGMCEQVPRQGGRELVTLARAGERHGRSRRSQRPSAGPSRLPEPGHAGMV